MSNRPDWLEALTHKDWLFDGSPIRGRVMLTRFENLDWSKARMDLGPSIAGNLGPYWHVPLKETVIDGQLYDAGDTVHRLYPKVLTSKWLLLIRQACQEIQERSDPENLRAENDKLRVELAGAKIRIADLERRSAASEGSASA